MTDNQSINIKNAKILKDMKKQVVKRRSFIDEHKKEWERDWYVRVSSTGLSAVSLNNETPLMGFTISDRKNISKYSLLDYFQKGKPEVPKRKVPERRVQCWLIRYALENSMDLKQVLLLQDSFCDKLIFCLDEVPLYDAEIKEQVRCDILAVGFHGNNAFPVIIEIKSGHHLTGPKGAITELNQFYSIIDNHKEELKDLLNTCLGRSDRLIVDPSHIHKMIIWNKEKGISKKTGVEIEKHNIELREYQWMLFKNQWKLDFHKI